MQRNECKLRCPDGASRQLTHGLVLGRGIYGLPAGKSISRVHSVLTEQHSSQHAATRWLIQPQGKNVLRLYRADKASNLPDIISAAGKAQLRLGDRLVLGAKDDKAKEMEVVLNTASSLASADRSSLDELTGAGNVKRFTNVAVNGGNLFLLEIDAQGLQFVKGGREVLQCGFHLLSGWDLQESVVQLVLRDQAPRCSLLDGEGRTRTGVVEMHTTKARHISAILAAHVRRLATVRLPPESFTIRLELGADLEVAEAVLHLAGETIKVMHHGNTLHSFDYNAVLRTQIDVLARGDAADNGHVTLQALSPSGDGKLSIKLFAGRRSK